MKSIILFFFLFITCASATDPTLQVVSDKDPCGCTTRQTTFIMASFMEAEEQLEALQNTMDGGTSIEEKALAGPTTEVRRSQSMQTLKGVASHLREAQTLRVFDKIADHSLGILSIICKDPNHVQPPVQGQGTVHQNVLHLAPTFFASLDKPASKPRVSHRPRLRLYPRALLPEEVVLNRVDADNRNYARALITHQESVTPFENDQYPMLWNPGSAILRFVLSSRLLTDQPIVLPEHQNYKGDNNALMWMALAFIAQYEEAMANPKPKQKFGKIDLSVPPGLTMKRPSNLHVVSAKTLDKVPVGKVRSKVPRVSSSKILPPEGEYDFEKGNLERPERQDV